MEEATLLDFNKHRGNQPKLIAIYPTEGTFFSDNPFIVLDGDWVSADQKAGRAGVPALPGRADHARGRGPRRLPARGPQGQAGRSRQRGQRRRPRPAQARARAARAARARAAEVARGARTASRPTSCSCSTPRARWSRPTGSRAPSAGLKVFLDQVAPQDRVGLTTFSDVITPLVPVAPVQGQPRAARGHDRPPDRRRRHVGVRRRGRGLRRPCATSPTAVTASTPSSCSPTARTRTRRAARGTSCASCRARATPRPRCACSRSPTPPSAQGAAEALDAIAAASGGKSYKGSTEDIESVYRSISSFF